MLVKPPLSFLDLVKKLDSRGCTIESTKEAERILPRINYYRLTGYLLPFKKDNDTYEEGTSLKKVLKIYDFDSKLRNLIFYGLQILEIDLRTKISYEHANNYGSLGYLNQDNFNDKFEFDLYLDNINKYVEREKNEEVIKHHINNYNRNIPFWVIIEYFIFGNLSKFYSSLVVSDQKKLSNLYNLNNRLVRSWLYCLTFLRNSCAHHERLYFKKFIPTPITPKNSDVKLNNSVFSYLFILRKMLANNEIWDTYIFPNIESLIIEYEDYIDLKHIGFPTKWLSKLK